MTFAKPPVHPLAKWFFIASFICVVGTVAGCSMLIGHFFKPNIHAGYTGGLADEHVFAGSIAVGPRVQVLGADGLYTFTTSKDDEFKRHCKDKAGDVDPKTVGDTTIFDMRLLSGAKCGFEIPTGKTLLMSLSKGKVSLSEPMFASRVDVDQGSVAFTPSAAVKYRVSARVDQGSAAKLESIDDKDAVELTLHVKTGAIEKGD